MRRHAITYERMFYTNTRSLVKGELSLEGRENELLDLIAELVSYSRAGTFDAAPGETEVWRRATAVLSRYRPDAESGKNAPLVLAGGAFAFALI